MRCSSMSNRRTTVYPNLVPIDLPTVISSTSTNPFWLVYGPGYRECYNRRPRSNVLLDFLIPILLNLVHPPQSLVHLIPYLRLGSGQSAFPRLIKSPCDLPKLTGAHVTSVALTQCHPARRTVDATSSSVLQSSGNKVPLLHRGTSLRSSNCRQACRNLRPHRSCVPLGEGTETHASQTCREQLTRSARQARNHDPTLRLIPSAATVALTRWA